MSIIVLGDCYAKQEDYANACASYEKALQIAPDNGSYYRDYAIALACSGNIEEAKNITQFSKEKGTRILLKQIMCRERSFLIWKII